MKLSLLLVFTIISYPTFLLAQTSSDCEGGITVCDDLYSETDAPLTAGSTIEIPFGSCNPTEVNSIWYIFTVQDDGFLNFTLDPSNDGNDYDWGLYDISDNGCDGISSGLSPEVSCNSWGVIGINGTTGISTNNGGVGNSNGPGDLNGPPFNEDLPVTAGTTYALAILNWSNSLEGYDLDFGTSTASLYDDDPPFIVSVTPNCSGAEITVVFSENVVIGSIENSDFSITGPNGLYAIGSVEAADGAGVTMDDSIIITLSDPLTESGSYTLMLEEGAEFILDACGNSASGSMDFDVSGLMTFDYEVTDACNGGGGVIDVFGLSGGIEPFELLLDGQSQSDYVLDNLTPGTYDVTLEDANDCVLTQTVEVLDFMLEVNAGNDTTLCAMNTLLGASYNGNDFLWTAPADVVIASETNPLSASFSNTEGTFALTATTTLGECVVTDFVNITFSIPLDPEIAVQRASCHAVCDGSVEVISNAGSLIVILNDSTLFGTQATFSGLCNGIYPLLITDFAGCDMATTVEIWEPPILTADFEISPDVIEVPLTTATLTSVSVNDSAYHWYIGNPLLDEAFDSTVVYTFPPGVGGVYDVVLFVSDGFGCMDSVLKQVIIEDNFMVFVPNTFTPDGDGINDFLLPQFSYTPQDFLFIIFNRWGEQVYRSTDYTKPWLGENDSGTHFGENAVYNWWMEVRGNEVEKRTLTGHVLLLR